MSKKKGKIQENKLPKFIFAADIPKYITRKEFIHIGEVKIHNNYYTEAGRKIEVSKIWFQRLIYVNQFILMMSLISMITLLSFSAKQESPTLFANFTSGQLMCSNNPLDINTGKTLDRESKKYDNICKNIDNFDSSTGD